MSDEERTDVEDAMGSEDVRTDERTTREAEATTGETEVTAGETEAADERTTGEIRLRPVRPEDADAVRDIYAPFVRETPVTFRTEVPSVAETRETVERRLDADRCPWYVAERGGDVVGYAYASRLRDRAAYRWVVETTVYVDPSAQRCGVGRALYDRLFETLRAQGYVAAYAALGMPNPESAAFHEATGFESVGAFPDAGFKLGGWHDVEWYRKALRDAPDDPDPPRPVSAVDPAFGDA